ncbi:MAG TPA: hypothetical protein VH185_05705 [Mycobacterium sp.]|nr:hypothetical protein [Mycobacterium sp.]
MADPAHTAYQEEAFSDINPGAFGQGVFFNEVPAGKRLVIEHVSVRAELPPGQKARASILVSLKGSRVSHSLVMVSQGTVIGQPTNRAAFFASQPMRLYTDAGQGAWGVTVERDAAVGLGVAYASISGYFVDVP